jgi:ABC-2 type transport system permease protein
MNKTWLVLKKELLTTLSRRSFLFTAFGLPLIGALIFAGVSKLRQKNPDTLENLIRPPEIDGISVEGYVDQANLITELPQDVSSGVIFAYPDETSAKNALLSGEINGYYIIPEDYIQSGKMIYVQTEFSPLAAEENQNTHTMRWILLVNILGGDMELASRANNPANIQVTALAPEKVRDQNNPLNFFIPYFTTVIFYVVILGASSLLLNSITKEKENRVIEVLLVSVSPQQLLAGKIIGLGIAGLIQTLIWVGTAYTIMNLSGRTFTIPSGFELPDSFLFWGVIFFLLGYALYASLMAGLGALVPNLREASQATFIIILPLLIPMFMIGIIANKPHGVASTFFSIFPLTSPVSMMTRLAAGGVSWWQPLLAIILLILTAFLAIRTGAHIFQAQSLLSGQDFSVKRFFLALLGKV